MSRSRNIACAVAVTVLLGAVVGVALWQGGGMFTRDGWEATSWVAGVGAFLLVGAPVWTWALRRPAFEQRHWGWVARVRNVTAEEVGVHRARTGTGVYVARDHDAQLRLRIRKAARVGGAVLVVGDSTAGKTRTMWEAVAALAPRRWLFVPALGADLSLLPDLVAAKNARRAVLWLDDVDKHLNTSGSLDHTLIQRLTNAGALVVMTLRTSAYHTYRDTVAPTPGVEAKEIAVAEAGSQLLRGLDPVCLERLWSSGELNRAARSGDASVAEAAARQAANTGHSVSEYLTAAPELVARWRHAKESVGTDGGHPRGHHLVAAAVDLARIGVESASLELLSAAHAHYEPPAHLRPEQFAEALAWATREQYGTCGLLIPTAVDPPAWRPFDYLVDTTATPIPPGLWDTALDHTSVPTTLLAVGLTAYFTGLPTIAETAWTRASEVGDTDAMTSLGVLFYERGKVDEAKEWWTRAAAESHTGAMVSLGNLLREQGEVGGAEAWYRRAAEIGDPDAMNNLSLLLQERGEVDEAEQWWTRAAADSHTRAMYNLGVLFYGRGEVEKAEQWWAQAAADSHTDAMVNLGVLFQDMGEDAKAEKWLRCAAEKDNPNAMNTLGGLLWKQGETAESEAWCRRAIEAGHIDAMVGLGVVLAEQGKGDEAEEWWIRASEVGDPNAMHNLGNRLAERGETEEAEAWLRRAIEAGHIDAMVGLGVALAEQGKGDEAEEWWTRAAQNGRTTAMHALEFLLEERGEGEEAAVWRRRAGREAGTDKPSRSAVSRWVGRWLRRDK